MIGGAIELNGGSGWIHASSVSPAVGFNSGLFGTATWLAPSNENACPAFPGAKPTFPISVPLCRPSASAALFSPDHHPTAAAGRRSAISLTITVVAPAASSTHVPTTRLDFIFVQAMI